MNNNEYVVAIVGATGLVGNELLTLLDRRAFPVKNLVLLASARSAGKTLSFRGVDHTVQEITVDSFRGVDVAFFSADDETSRQYVPIAAEAGALVIDNTTVFRMDSDVPLVVPPVNGEDIKNAPRRIIANPNCTTAIATTALAPLHRAFGIDFVIASSYQAVSGWGREGMKELDQQVDAIRDNKPVEVNVFDHQIAFNAIPHINDFLPNGYTIEEEKMRLEGSKIMHHPSLKLSHTAVNVPVYRAHSMALHISLSKPASAEEVRAVLAKANGIEVIDAPEDKKYPMPITASQNYNCQVGRIRVDSALPNGIALWVSGDQLWRGAALNALEIAELAFNVTPNLGGGANV